MKTKNLNESFWRRIKFILLFTLVIVLLYIIQTKFIIKIPVVDNVELLSAIGNYEKVIEKQNEYTEKIKKINEEIKVMKFDVHQVQKKDEINKNIFKVRLVYKESNMNSKFFFGIQSANILQIYFDIKEDQSSMLKNKKIITDNLNECRANI